MRYKEINPVLERFISSLTPNDVGIEKIDNYVVAFEGFSEDVCWPDYFKRLKDGSISDLSDIEEEITHDWKEKLPNHEMILADWQNSVEPGEGNVFYAIFT